MSVVIIQRQTTYPAFIERAGQILTRKLYEYRLVDGRIVAVDLPQPGQLPEYLTQLQVKQWQLENEKFLRDHAPRK